MPRRQAEYNPSYIQISSRDHRADRGMVKHEGEGGGRTGRGLVTVTSRRTGQNRAEHRRDSHLITLKMFYPSAFSSLSLGRLETAIFFFMDGYIRVLSVFVVIQSEIQEASFVLGLVTRVLYEEDKLKIQISYATNFVEIYSNYHAFFHEKFAVERNSNMKNNDKGIIIDAR